MSRGNSAYEEIIFKVTFTNDSRDVENGANA